MNSNLQKTLTAGLMYGLKFESSLDQIEVAPPINRYWTARGIDVLFNDWCITTVENSDAYPIQTVKPYLFPMSSLTKEIECNGEKFIPIHAIIVIGQELKYLRTDEDARMLSYFLSHPLGWDDLEKIDKAPHWVFELFCMWHFNCFNLSSEEFIEVNETNNPYK